MTNNTNFAAPGTVAYEAIAWLRENPNASTIALGAGMGRNPKRLTQQLQGAILAGLILREQVKQAWIWNVGTQAEFVMSTAATDDDAREVVKVSAMAAPSIFAYADQRGAAPFSCALSTDGRLEVQRHGRVVLELNGAERKLLLASALGVAA